MMPLSTLAHHAMLVAALLPLGAFAQRQPERAIHTSVNPMLVEALHKGTSQGILIGKMADKFASQFESNTPLLVNVSVVKRYNEPGCARLAMDFIKEDAKTDKGRGKVKLASQLNYCVTGKPPRDER